MFFEYIKAIIYGIIEGITEWLPISSTGHLILLEKILSFELDELFDPNTAQQFLAMFDVVIQLGAILAVVFIYWQRLYPFGKQRTKAQNLWFRLILATIPAALIGISIDFICEKYMGQSLDAVLFEPHIVACALIVYGILFILVEKLTQAKSSASIEISYKSALAIGFFQALAIIPGTSRSGATILGARILNIPRESAAEFSFFAAVPIIFAASLLKAYDFFKYSFENSVALPPQAFIILMLAGITAFFTSLLTIKLLTDFVKKHSFIPFGIYRIILGLSVLLILG